MKLGHGRGAIVRFKPIGGATSAAGSDSGVLLVMNGNADASSCAPATWAGAGADSAGPLSLARLLRRAPLGCLGV